MKKTGSKTEDAVLLREKAEELLQKRALKKASQVSEHETLELMHELEVHQIELELQNEELLLAKEQAELATDKYVELYDFAPSGYFTLSREGKIVELNLCASQMLGKDRSRLINSSLGFFVTDDTKPAFNLFLDKVFKSKAKESCEVTLSAGSGLPICVHLSGIVIEKKMHCLVNMVDLTESRLEEENVRKTEQRFRSYFDMPLVGIAITSVEKGWLEVNDKVCSLLGYSRKKLKQITWAELTHPEDLAADMANFNLLLSGKLEQYTMEKRFIRKDGGIVYVDLAVGCVRNPDGTVDYVVALLNDITERKRSEAVLRQSEERYRTLADYTYDWETWIKPDNTFQYISPSCERITGYGPNAFIENPQLLQDIIHPEDKAVAGNHFADIIEEPKVCHVDFRIITKSGAERYVNHICQAVYDGDGKFIGRRGSSRDITDRKRLEEELVQARKYETMSTFSAGIAHDFNNLLSGVLNYITLTKDGINKLPEDALKFLEEAEKIVFKARDITGEFLT
ncbi:MAG: PAS domain S-box protein, partial [Pseudomonadota bacterium]